MSVSSITTTELFDASHNSPRAHSWTLNPYFGILHSSGCSICLSYIRHAACDINEPTLKRAIQEQAADKTLSYLQGFREGEGNDPSWAIDFEAILSERDEAISIAQDREKRLAAIVAELAQAKEHLSSLQDLLNDVMDSCAPSQSLFDDHSAGTSGIVSGESENKSFGLHPQQPGGVFLTPPPSPPPQPPIPPDRTLQPPISDDLNVAPFYTASPSKSRIKPPKTLVQLQTLMTKARENDPDALHLVKALYTQARSTPPALRTPLQEFILFEWNIPEIFVDSSSWGIGFVYNGRWCSWPFKLDWRGKGRDNTWAEMIAVELGLRMAIDAGLHNRKIIIRSDHQGVVQALVTGKSKHPLHPEILHEINQLKKCHMITLECNWVPTKDNPADKPSRGEFPPDILRFPISIEIPPRLLPFFMQPA